MNRAHRQKRLKTTITTTITGWRVQARATNRPHHRGAAAIQEREKRGGDTRSARGTETRFPNGSCVVGTARSALPCHGCPICACSTNIHINSSLLSYTHAHTHASTQIQTAVRSATQRGAKKHEKTSKNLVLLETRRRLRNINLLLRARLQIKVESASHSTLLRPPHRNGGGMQHLAVRSERAALGHNPTRFFLRGRRARRRASPWEASSK